MTSQTTINPSRPMPARTRKAISMPARVGDAAGHRRADGGAKVQGQSEDAHAQVEVRGAERQVRGKQRQQHTEHRRAEAADGLARDQEP